MNYVNGPDILVEFGSNEFHGFHLPRVDLYLRVLGWFFHHFQYQGLGFGVTSGLGLGVLILSILGLLSQSRVVRVLSGSVSL